MSTQQTPRRPRRIRRALGPLFEPGAVAELREPQAVSITRSDPPRHMVAVYPYDDEDNQLLSGAVRYEPKGFRCHRARLERLAADDRAGVSSRRVPLGHLVRDSEVGRGRIARELARVDQAALDERRARHNR